MVYFNERTDPTWSCALTVASPMSGADSTEFDGSFAGVTTVGWGCHFWWLFQHSFYLFKGLVVGGTLTAHEGLCCAIGVQPCVGMCGAELHYAEFRETEFFLELIKQ